MYPEQVRRVVLDLDRGINGVSRVKFLHFIKFNPERLAVAISDELRSVVIRKSSEMGITCYVNNSDDDAMEVIEACRKHFAGELANVTAT